MLSQRKKLGGFLPQRKTRYQQLDIPSLDDFKVQLDGTDRENSTTMVFVRILSSLVKHKQIGKRIVPIVPDEARTFGMEGMFRQIGIYTAEGQKYKPHDANQVMFYKEDKTGQILEEGINEAGAFAAWLAAATSIANNDLPMIPFLHLLLYVWFSESRRFSLGSRRLACTWFFDGSHRRQNNFIG